MSFDVPRIQSKSCKTIPQGGVNVPIPGSLHESCSSIATENWVRRPMENQRFIVEANGLTVVRRLELSISRELYFLHIRRKNIRADCRITASIYTFSESARSDIITVFDHSHVVLRAGVGVQSPLVVQINLLPSKITHQLCTRGIVRNVRGGKW